MLGYTTAAVLAVIAITSAHYSQTRADEVAAPGTANAARAQGAAPARQYLPQLTLPEQSPSTPPSLPGAPTTQAIAEPEPVALTSSTEPSATREPTPPTTSEQPSSPVTSTPVPSQPSTEPSQPSETTAPSEPSETTEPPTSAPPTSEPTQPSQPDETTEPSKPSQPGLLPLVGGVVDGLTDPLLGR